MFNNCTIFELRLTKNQNNTDHQKVKKDETKPDMSSAERNFFQYWISENY